MPIIDQIGLTGPIYEMDIERGKIRDFAKAMSAPLPEFVSGRTPIVPATFFVTAPYTWGYTLERPRGTVFETIGHDLSVPLHAEESFRFHGTPPQAGLRLTCRGSLEDVRVKQGAKGGKLTFLTLLTEYWGPAGQLIAEQRSTTVTTDQAPDEGEWHVELPPYEPAYPTLEPAGPFTHVKRVSWDDLVVGEGPGQLSTGPLLMRDMVRFQGVVGEDNPLHYDIGWAAANGYPNVFGLGMHQASVLAGYAAHWLDPNAVRFYKMRFRNVYWPGDVINYDLHVSRKYVDAVTQHRMAELELLCKRDPGDPLVQGWMTLDFGAV